MSKLKAGVNHNEGTTLRIRTKMFDSNNLPHELFLTIKQNTILRNVIKYNMSVDINLSKAQISKIIQSGGF